MGGSVDMTSRPGAGTTATLTLPMARLGADALPSAPRDDFAARLRARRPAPGIAEALAAGTLVLVVDDNPLNQLVMRSQLEVLGYACEAASNGVEGLERWGTGRYALVLADCHMPVMDGYEFARRVRRAEADGGLRRTPIVACTANALRGEDAACREAGMDDYLCKPIELAELDARLARWLPRS
jgi:two-component system sensor histidine kinase EvgS